MIESRPGPGRLEAIWIKRAHRGPMDPVSHATAVGDRGLAGNAGNSRTRQITIIEQEVWDELMEHVEATADPASRRANLMVSGLSLAESRGRTLRIGDVRLRIAGETKPCERMEAVAPGLQEAMWPGWRGGAFAQVVVEGELRVGDPVEWVDGDA